MAIEIISAGMEYEAHIHCMSDNAAVYSDYYLLERPEIDAVSDIPLHPNTIKTMTYVDISERASLRIKHQDNPLLARGSQNAPYRVPDYPEEDIYGERMLQSETWLVTDRNDLDLEFTSISEILQAQRLSPYALRWMGLMAGGNYRPSFFSKINKLLTGE